MILVSSAQLAFWCPYFCRRDPFSIGINLTSFICLEITISNESNWSHKLDSLSLLQCCTKRVSQKIPFCEFHFLSILWSKFATEVGHVGLVRYRWLRLLLKSSVFEHNSLLSVFSWNYIFHQAGYTGVIN